MGLPVGKYRTRSGSEMTVSGEHGGISRVEFDWMEERACPDCTPEPYADDDGFLVWRCDECGGGCAAFTALRLSDRLDKEVAMGFFKKLFCGHSVLEFVRNIYGDEIIARGWKRSIWRCGKCGATVAKDDLHSG